MSEATSQQLQERVLVLAPTARDANICRNLLGEAGLIGATCSDLPEICRHIEQGAAVAVITEEAMQPDEVVELVRLLERQPAWSDFPILVLVQEGATSPTALEMLATLGNVTLLERPVRVPTLISAVQSALRARRRQYQIRDLLQAAAETAETLRQEAQRKDEFLAMLAHELRNPLAPIRNGVAILKLNPAESDEAVPILEMMERQIGHMVRLVDDLLDVSRILRGKISLQREVLDLPAIIKQAVETVQPLIDAQRHELTLSFGPGPLQVKGDAVRLAQVFANLLNNAAKYTEPGGHIHVKVERLGERRLAASVCDNGMGIAPDMLPRVFELFSQAERSLDRSQGGLGLGLTLVRRLVEMHGGSVSVTSAGLSRGSVFRVELPAFVGLGVRDNSTLAMRPALGQADSKRRILVVDDNRDAADSLARLLTAAGHHVQTHYDGPTALEQVASFQPDVVLLDVGLPGMSGYDVARCLRNSKPELLLVAVTGYGQEEDRRSTAAAGFDHHLVKPVDLPILNSVLNGVELKLTTSG